MLWKAPAFSPAFSWVRGMAQTDAPQLLQCTTNRAILSIFPWQLKARFDFPYTAARSAGAGQDVMESSHKSLGRQTATAISSATSRADPPLNFTCQLGSRPFASLTYLLAKEIFLISPAEGARQRLNLQYFASTANGFIILPQRVQAICASPKEKNNKQFKTCQHVSKLLTEQLFKPTWVTYKIKLSPHCGTQAE